MEGVSELRRCVDCLAVTYADGDRCGWCRSSDAERGAVGRALVAALLVTVPAAGWDANGSPVEEN